MPLPTRQPLGHMLMQLPPAAKIKWSWQQSNADARLSGDDLWGRPYFCLDPRSTRGSDNPA